MIRILAVLMVGLVASAAQAQELVERKVLTEKPLSGAEETVVVVSTLKLMPGGRIPLHTHPGDEHAVIVSGGDVLMPNGNEVTVPPNTPMFFPAGMVHGGVTNRGDAVIEIVTTHILAAGQPFATPAE